VRLRFSLSNRGRDKLRKGAYVRDRETTTNRARCKKVDEGKGEAQRKRKREEEKKAFVSPSASHRYIVYDPTRTHSTKVTGVLYESASLCRARTTPLCRLHRPVTRAVLPLLSNRALLLNDQSHIADYAILPSFATFACIVTDARAAWQVSHCNES